MSDPMPSLEPRPALADVGMPVGIPGLTVVERSDLILASLLAGGRRRCDLASRISARFGIELPESSCRRQHAGIAFAGLAPDAWLASAANPEFVEELRAVAGEAGSVSEQTDGYAVVQLEGPRAREVLGGLAPVDLHPRKFPVGAVACTRIAHIPIILWHSGDAKVPWQQYGAQPSVSCEDSAPYSRFEIACPRSYASSFIQELSGIISTPLAL